MAEKPQEGTWTLTAPDGRTWQAESPLRCVVAEQNERMPAAVQLRNIRDAVQIAEDEQAELTRLRADLTACREALEKQIVSRDLERERAEMWRGYCEEARHERDDLQQRAQAAEAKLAECERDAKRGRYMLRNCAWHRGDEQGDSIVVYVPHGTDLSCVATREHAIDAALTKEGQK